MSDKITKDETEQQIRNAVDKEFLLYNTDVKGVINWVETYAGGMPEGLLLETKNFLGHLSTALTDENASPNDRMKDVESAHKHLRRIMLDCLKLMCICKQRSIKDFLHEYRFYNLNDVDDGKFKIKIHSDLKKADKIFNNAKNTDKTGNNSSEKEPALGEFANGVYEEYCNAITKYDEIIHYIDEHYEGVIRVATKSKIAKVVSVLGWAVGIALSIVLFIIEHK